MYSFFKHVFFVMLIGLITTSVVNAQHFTDFEFYEGASANILQTSQNNAKAVFRQIHESFFNKRQSITLSSANATPEAIERIRDLWSTSKFYCVETYLMKPVARIPDGGWQVRDVPVFFIDGGTPEEQYQELVLEFTSNGTISDIYIALPMHQRDKIFKDATEVTDLRRRQLILGFVENFRTAYNRKDINYIEDVFSNEALIITGKVTKRNGDSPNPRGVEVTYVTHNKQTYINNLKGVFSRNSFINIKFEDIEVVKGNENVYGVTLKQHWNASNYSDVGWLFLMIDYKDENNPLIWVRTWEPPEVPKNKVIGLDNFIFD